MVDIIISGNVGASDFGSSQNMKYLNFSSGRVPGDSLMFTCHLDTSSSTAPQEQMRDSRGICVAGVLLSGGLRVLEVADARCLREVVSV